jgi:hypothetical protein
VEDEMNNNDADIFPVVASSVTYATGHDGQSVNFPAISGNYVNLPITISGNQLSIAFWANADAANGDRGFFNYNYNNGYRGRISGGVAQAVVLGSSGTYSGTVIIPTSQWMHYVYTFDGSTGEVDVYINGVRDIDQTMSGGFSLSATYLQIGKSWTNTELFDGGIDEFMIYNKRLNQTEVSALYGYAS